MQPREPSCGGAARNHIAVDIDGLELHQCEVGPIVWHDVSIAAIVGAADQRLQQACRSAGLRCGRGSSQEAPSESINRR